MTLEEFISIKNELIELVIEFEQTERKISFLNNTYILEFYGELEQQRYLQYENDYLIKAIAMHSDGKSEEEVKAFLEECRKDFTVQINSFYRQHRLAKEMESQIKSYKKADVEKMDQEFINYCSVHHPLVKAHSTPLEREAYSSLILLYRSGNLTGFKNFMKECTPIFSSPEVSSDEYEEISRLYQESIAHLKEISQNKDKVFPLNKEDIFAKEELMTRELIYLREKNYQTRDVNKALQADFKLHFSFEFSL